MTKTAVSTFGSLKLVYFMPHNLFVLCDYHLCDTVAVINDEWFLAVIDKDYSYISGIISISFVIPLALYPKALHLYIYV